MTDAINIRLTLDQDAPIDDYLYDDHCISEYFLQADGTYQVIIKDVDDALIESLNPDDLAEFIGIDSEFVIAIQVLEFA